MLRRVLMTLLLGFTGRAAAHGPVPAASELLAVRDGEASLVRLTTGGFALRAGEGFRFLCPESWGGDVLAPAAALASGPSLIASDALWLVEQDGRVAPHPVQSGVGRAMVSAGDAVFALFEHDGQHELRRLRASSNELLRVLELPYDALAASTGELSLLHWQGDSLLLQRLTLDGASLERVTWRVPNGVAYARLRYVGGQLYVSSWGNGSPWVTLGRIADGQYQALREANVDVAGPVAQDALLALDGMLQRMDTGMPIDTQGRRLSCLGELDGTTYACASGDLWRVDAAGLGAALFALAALQEPDYQPLSSAARSGCRARWLDLRVDLGAAQASLVDAAVSAADASARTAPNDAGCSLPARTTAPGGLALALLYVARRHKKCDRRD